MLTPVHRRHRTSASHRESPNRANKASRSEHAPRRETDSSVRLVRTQHLGTTPRVGRRPRICYRRPRVWRFRPPSSRYCALLQAVQARSRNSYMYTIAEAVSRQLIFTCMHIVQKSKSLLQFHVDQSSESSEVKMKLFAVLATDSQSVPCPSIPSSRAVRMFFFLPRQQNFSSIW